MTCGRETSPEMVRLIRREWAQRERRAVTRKELAQRLGVGITTIQRIISGQHVSDRAPRLREQQARTLVKARAARVERQMTPAEIARIRSLWGCTDVRISQHEIAKIMGVSEYAVQQAIAVGSCNIYAKGSGTDALIAYGKANSAINREVARVMAVPR